MISEFAELRQLARSEIAVRGLSVEHSERLEFELREIEKQSTESYWLGLYNDNKKFKGNKNQLILPWLLNMLVGAADKDPIASSSQPLLNSSRVADVNAYKQQYALPKYMIKDQDMPDIDLDCLPKARDPIKQYATERYGVGLKDELGYGPVCSVGTWQTYKFKSALTDVCAAMGKIDKSVITKITATLPEDVDDLAEGGYSTCKGRIKDTLTGIESDCNTKHQALKCPVCGSEATASPTLASILKEYPDLGNFFRASRDNANMVVKAAKLIGRIRNMGMHAGALIIADRNLYGNIPMARSRRNDRDYWISMWSEGRNTQLSKFGYVKWDILGLKTLNYIYNCCKLIQTNRGIKFGNRDVIDGQLDLSGWDEISPADRRAGYFYDPDGGKHEISLDDPYALKLAHEQKTDGVFQFDTQLAMSILKNGVRRFEDLLLFNAMGHPGPMQSIPEAVANRDSRDDSWKDRLRDIHPVMLDILEDTYGVIVWQEQLAALWQRLGGFTAPEAQEARKAVAKKWVHKLKPVRDKWIAGATKTIGAAAAEHWWSLMVTFGRYAFNKSHGISYCLMAHRCLWLKAHFAPEWWAAVMSECHRDKLTRYMGVARSEKWNPTEITKLGYCKEDAETVKFDTINLFNLTTSFTVTDNMINQGLLGIKGIGKKVAPTLEGDGDYTDIDDFVVKKFGASPKKIVMERFIKLGAFNKFKGHENTRALWMYYQYAYGRDNKFRKEIDTALLKNEGWTDESIANERERATAEYLRQFPKRRKIPAKIRNWKPTPTVTRESVMALYPDNFSLAEQLDFEKSYLGYYLHSPMELYDTQGDFGIENAIQTAMCGGEPCLKVVINEINSAKTKTNNKDYLRVIVSDGMKMALIFMWYNELVNQDNLEEFVPGVGIQVNVDYDQSRGTFTVRRGEQMMKLYKKGWNNAVGVT